MQGQMIFCREHDEVLPCVVVFVLVAMVNVFVRSQWASDYSLGDNSVPVAAEELPVGRGLDREIPANLRFAIVLAPNLAGRHIVGVSIPPESLRVLAAIAVSAFFGGLATAWLTAEPGWPAGRSTPF
jgi:hypothetical protein